MRRPKASIIMPTYNRAKMMRRAVKSALHQTMEDFELIIVNDGSRDDTRDTVFEIGDPRIVYLEKNNGGVSSARNFGLRRARGRYISYLDDDNIYYPNHLKLLSEYLDRHPAVGLVYGKVHFKEADSVYVPCWFDYSKNRLELDNCIPSNALMHRRMCIKKAGFFDEGLAIGEDWDMWLRISDSYKLHHLRRFVAQHRFHPKNRISLIDYSKSYMRTIKKRLAMNRKAGIRDMPFKGYYLGIMYRLRYKFKVNPAACIDFMKELADMDSGDPELRLVLSMRRFTRVCVPKENVP